VITPVTRRSSPATRRFYTGETMKLDRSRLILIVLTVIVLGVMVVLGNAARAELPAFPEEVEQSVQARVIEVLDEGMLDQGGIEVPYQVLRLEILEGDLAGRAVEAENGGNSLAGTGIRYQPEDRVMVLRIVRPELGDLYIITDVIRVDALVWLAIIFVVFILLIARTQGVRSLLGMAVSLLMITQYMLPMILAGRDPVLIAVTGAFVQLAVTLYLIYGWRRKTHGAVGGMLVSLILTGVLASFFMNATRLTGQGAEETLFLQASGVSINLRGLLLAGIIIGALGVLDDITISQASAVNELRRANPDLSPLEVYRRAMNIGRDHVASTVNTLVLAYVGAALPLLLLFAIYPRPFMQVVNSEFVAEEIVRTLVGSLGLVLSVPITTFLSSVVFREQAVGEAEGIGHAGHVH
jgi:uncharacterized membrane protein